MSSETLAFFIGGNMVRKGVRRQTDRNKPTYKTLEKRVNCIGGSLTQTITLKHSSCFSMKGWTCLSAALLGNQRACRKAFPNTLKQLVC